MTVNPSPTTDKRPRSAWLVAAGLVAIGMTATACSDSEPGLGAPSPDTTVETDQTQPDQLADAGPQDGGATDDGTPADSVDLSELEEPPTTEPETFDEQLEATDFVEEAAVDHEKEAIAQTTCSGLADTIVETTQSLLDELGPAERTDDQKVNEAFEQFGLNGVLINRKADDLGCGDSEMRRLTCESADQLTAQGQVGQDLIDIMQEACL